MADAYEEAVKQLAQNAEDAMKNPTSVERAKALASQIEQAAQQSGMSVKDFFQSLTQRGSMLQGEIGNSLRRVFQRLTPREMDLLKTTLTTGTGAGIAGGAGAGGAAAGGAETGGGSIVGRVLSWARGAIGPGRLMAGGAILVVGGVIVYIGAGIAGRLAADKPIVPGRRLTGDQPPTIQQPATDIVNPPPGQSDTWVRGEVVFASADIEGRMPKWLKVSDGMLTFQTEQDGKPYTNTLTWSPPPATLNVGDDVTLTISSTTEPWAGVGGWWNNNCFLDVQGDLSAGSTKNYRLTGSPDPHNATCKFQFSPRDSTAYIQLSGGHDPAPDTWILATYWYKRQADK